jgi:hypothetical protein
MSGEKNTESSQRSLRYLSLKDKRSYNSFRSDNCRSDSHNDGCDDNHEKWRYNDDLEYRSYFTSYAQFGQPTQHLLKLIDSKFELSRPICMQLQDILKKIVRQGDLTQYLKPEFYKK